VRGSLPSRLAILRELVDPGERGTFLGVCAVAAGVPALVRLPLPRLGRLLGGRAPRGPRVSPEAIARLARLVRLAQLAGHPLIRPGCLTRGVTLLWLLRRRGLDIELCFGLDASSEPVDGHCWLELDGVPILEPTDPRARFAPQYRLGRA
jgi:hypothetical protein